jgi:hypothetical protein
MHLPPLLRFGKWRWESGSPNETAWVQGPVSSSLKRKYCRPVQHLLLLHIFFTDRHFDRSEFAKVTSSLSEILVKSISGAERLVRLQRATV